MRQKFKNLDAHFADYALKIIDECKGEGFLVDGWQRRGIERWDASRILVDLSRQSIESYMRSRGLSAFQMASGQIAWWGSVQAVPVKQVSFSWNTIAGSRHIQGFSTKRKALEETRLSQCPSRGFIQR